MKKNSLIKQSFIGFGLIIAAAPAYALKFEIPKELQAQVDAEAAAEQPVMSFGDTETSTEVAVDDSGFETMDAVVDEVAVEDDSLEAGEGRITGRVVDKETGAPIAGVAILLEGTDAGTVTDSDGAYRIQSAPEGLHTLSFIKSGYIEANVTEFEVVGGETKEFAFALPPRPAEMSDDVYELQDFSVTADEANDMMVKLDLRLESVQALDVFSSEDFSKFAVSNVGEALKKLPGVTVEDGKFAVIRGLDERYTSTLFNGAPIPSPDPVKQSVPLDLFPSEVVENIVVSKTYSARQPGNSVGGNIQISSTSFSDELVIKGSFSTGFNENAQDEFYSDGDRPRVKTDFSQLGSYENRLAAESFNEISRLTPRKETPDWDHEFSLQVGNTVKFYNRDLRFMTVFGVETEYDSAIGTEEKRTATAASIRRGQVVGQGDYVKGTLTETEGAYDLVASLETERTTNVTAVEYDLNPEGTSKIGYNYFYNEEEQYATRVRDNGNYFGYDPDGDGHDLDDIMNKSFTADMWNDLLSRGALDEDDRLDAYYDTSLWKFNVNENTRELEVHQVHGEFGLESLSDDLVATWLYSHSETTQEEVASVDTAGWLLPDDFLAPGVNYIVGSGRSALRDFVAPSIQWRKNEEEQDYGSFELRDDVELFGGMPVGLVFGLSHEETDRGVHQEVYTLDVDALDIKDASPAATPEDALAEENVPAGTSNWPNQSTASDPAARTSSDREVSSMYFEYEADVNDFVTFSLGARYESVEMNTETIPGDSGADFFNYDLLRRSALLDPSDPTDDRSPAYLNAQLLGLPDALPSDFVGEIDEDYVLPAASFVIKPMEGVRAIFAYSETVARPSFREFTYLTTRDPLTGDYTTGNPTLTTSDATSYDFRLEYFTDTGSMVAVGLFWKNVESPIEKTVLGGSDASSEFFYNNPNDAEIYGVEFEFRKNLADNLDDTFFEYFSVGGNVSFIESEVESLDSLRALHEEGFILVGSDGNPLRSVGGGYYGDQDTGSLTGFESERSLVNQPDWLANFDVSFDQPEWGTRATLSVFAQSDVLRTAQAYDAGSIPNRYEESFYELNFALSQRIFDRFTLGFSVKNLTDTERNLVYDDDYFSSANPERSVKLGRSYSFSISGEF